MNQQPFQFVVIDDDSVNNMVSAEFIKMALPGVATRTFVNPEKGVGYLREQLAVESADKLVLFLDINMHELSGWEVLDELATYQGAANGKMKTFILSSSVDLNDKQRAEQHPLVSGYITKFLSKDKILALLPIINN